MSNRKKKKVNRQQFIALIITVPILLLFFFDYKSVKSEDKIVKAFFHNGSDFIGKQYNLEVAVTLSERQTGLMYRKSMPQNEGMLFKFPSMQKQSFWMKNTFIPLDFIFLNQSYKIVDLVENVPAHSKRKIIPDKPAKYTIELNAGEIKRLGLQEGHTLKVID